MSVQRITKNLTKMAKQLDTLAERERDEIIYLEKRLLDSKKEAETAAKISTNIQKLLT